MFLLILSLSLKILSRPDVSSVDFKDICTTYEGKIETITGNCSIYNYISSECIDCKVEHISASVNFINCTFLQTGKTTLINLEATNLKIFDSSFCLTEPAANYLSTRFVTTTLTSTYMKNTEIENENYRIDQKSPNIESKDPKDKLVFDTCKFKNINCDLNSGSGIYVFSEYNDYLCNISFIACCTYNVSSKKAGGFYYQSKDLGILIIDRCTFDKCFAKEGGAFFISTEFILENTAFIECESYFSGSIIYFLNHDFIEAVIISNCTFDNNKNEKCIFEVISLNDTYIDSISFNNCTFLENIFGSVSIIGISTNEIVHNTSFFNCLIEKNNNTNNCLMNIRKTTLYVINCEFIDNTAHNINTIISKDDNIHIINCLFDQKLIAAIKSDSDKTILINTTFKNFKKDYSYIGTMIFFLNGYEVNIIGCKFIEIAAEDYGGIGIGYYDDIKVFRFKNCLFENSYGDHRPNGFIFPYYRLSNLTITGCKFVNCSCQRGSFIGAVDHDTLICRMNIKVINSSFYKCFSALKLGIISIQFRQETAKLLVYGCTFDSIPEGESIILATICDVLVKNSVFSSVSKIFDIKIQKYNMVTIDGIHVHDCASNGPFFVIRDAGRISFKNCILNNISGLENDIIELDSKVIPIDLMTLNNCTFMNVQYSKKGFNLEASTLNVLNSNFINNTAELGAGLFVEPKTYIYIESCTFINNSASKSGGCIFFGRQSNYETKNLSAYNNSAKESGAIVHMYEVYGNCLPEFEGYGNASPTGSYHIEGGEITLHNITSDEVTFSNVHSLCINNHNGKEASLRIINTDSIELYSLKLKRLEAEGKSIRLNNNVNNECNKFSLKMQIDATITDCSFLDSPNILIETPYLLISNCKFKYDRKSEEQSQMVINSISDVTILNSCFITNTNQFDDADFIKSDSPIKLSIDDLSCFNKNITKSISIHDDSIINFGNCFNCERNCMIIKTEELLKETTTGFKYLDLAISLPVAIIVITIVAVLVVVLVRKHYKTKSSMSDSKPLEEMSGLYQKSSVIISMSPASADVGTNYIVDFEES